MSPNSESTSPNTFVKVQADTDTYDGRLLPVVTQYKRLGSSRDLT
jgi:hypothetical protein